MYKTSSPLRRVTSSPAMKRGGVRQISQSCRVVEACGGGHPHLFGVKEFQRLYSGTFDVRYWHKADIALLSSDVCYWG
jgi:hypothetical protein